jgi:hypothetical protein
MVDDLGLLCLFLKQFGSFNFSFQSSIFQVANVFCHVCVFNFVFLLEIFKLACRCFEEELFVFRLSH